MLSLIRNLLSTALAKVPEPARARLYRAYRPRLAYLLFPRTTPISRSYWTERGGTIDRYFIERFLAQNGRYIQGACLEIRSADYIHRFGRQVTRVEVLDIDRSNTQATIYGDLRHLDGIPDASYDCLIITQTLQYIDDLDAALREMLRILKPGGTALVTVPSLQKRDIEGRNEFWRFTEHGTRHLFSKHFPAQEVQVQTWGNVLTGMAFWIGLAQEEVKDAHLEEHDPTYPCIISARATKPA